ncbi:MAG: hypothetical protein JKY65_28405 [Planctomycetes bacterium]|nr:hypothetical protein [Planctomycetota bacterium]
MALRGRSRPDLPLDLGVPNHRRAERSQDLDLCPDCHSAIHRLIPSEKALARQFATREQLLAHEELGKFVAWVSTREGKRRYRIR